MSRQEANRLIGARAASIAAEPRGNYYVGRRYVIKHVRFWGFLRRPGEPWKGSKLVVMNESQKRVPDRLLEALPGATPAGRTWGYDHNYEYKVFGRFTGRTIYDPNANMELPEFILTGIELIDKYPGYLFLPGENYDGRRLPPRG